MKYKIETGMLVGKKKNQPRIPRPFLIEETEIVDEENIIEKLHEKLGISKPIKGLKVDGFLSTPDNPKTVLAEKPFRISELI